MYQTQDLSIIEQFKHMILTIMNVPKSQSIEPQDTEWMQDYIIGILHHSHICIIS